jgi:hypothetical protein
MSKLRHSWPHGILEKIKDRKRHIPTDSMGLPVGAIVHTADIQDRDGAPHLLASIRAGFPWLRHSWSGMGSG